MTNNFSFNKKAISIIIIILYVVGACGFFIPYSRALFIQLTPLTLLVTALLLLGYHETKNTKFYLTSFIIMLLGYIIELIGVHTGIPFGQYSYGNGLGFKLFSVPPMIGVNWFIMVYLSAHLCNQFILLKNNLMVKSIIGGVVMVLFDFIIEPFAIKFDLWSWAEVAVPTANYIAWFAIGFLFHLIWHSLVKNRTVENIVATTLFICFVAFFVILLFA